MDFIFVVHPSESVGRVPVHVSVAVWSTSVTKQNGDLMESFWRKAPEVESHIRVLGIVRGITLLAVNKIWELDRIFNEKDWGIVSDHVVVTFFCVMLDGKSTGVTIAVIGTSFTSNS
jgi:hypothetical protein